MVKKSLKWIGIISCIIIVLCIISCDGNLSDEHTHKFSSWQTVSLPTCTLAGNQTRTCTACGFSEYSTISPLGHTEAVDRQVAATCTSDGKTAGTHCSTCGESLSAQQIIKSTGHKYDDGTVVKDATCQQKGSKLYTCTSCSHSYNEEYSLPIYTATEINNQSIGYVGEIITYDKSGNEQSLGTGFVYGSDGKVITNYHVIDEAYSAKITINGVSYNIASVLAFDENIDLAVLKINANGLTAANICKNPVQVGETVYAIGSSRGLTDTFSQGIITYADRVVDGVSHIQHDASITHGNSGGPLINQYGEVIGINTWGISDSQNLNFAVFADELDNLVYGTPITLSELFEQKYGAYDMLTSYVLNYGTYNSQEQRYEIEDKIIEASYSDYYTLCYYTDSENLWLYNGYYDYEGDKWSAFVGICFNKDERGLYYCGTYSEEDIHLNETIGFFDPATFTDSTSTLPYTSFDGLHSSKDQLLGLYCESITYMLGFLEYLFEKDDVALTLADLGFTSYVS